MFPGVEALPVDSHRAPIHMSEDHSLLYLTIYINPGGKFVISLLMFHSTLTMSEAILSTLTTEKWSTV